MPIAVSDLAEDAIPLSKSIPIDHTPVELLTTLPAELLLELLYTLDDDSLLSLKHTSRFFHILINTNAPLIANTIINRQHKIEASLFKPVLSPSGYLVPSHPCILESELHVARYILDRMDTTDVASTSFLHERPLLISRLSRPGPTFLRFLRSRSNLWVEAGMLKEGSVTAETHGKRLGLYYVRPFLDAENCKDIYVQRGFRSRKNSFLRDL